MTEIFGFIIDWREVVRVVFISNIVISSYFMVGLFLEDYSRRKDISTIFIVPLSIAVCSILAPMFVIPITVEEEWQSLFEDANKGYAWLFGKVDPDYISVFLPVIAVLGLFLI